MNAESKENEGGGEQVPPPRLSASDLDAIRNEIAKIEAEIVEVYSRLAFSGETPSSENKRHLSQLREKRRKLRRREKDIVNAEEVRAKKRQYYMQNRQRCIANALRSYYRRRFNEVTSQFDSSEPSQA